MIIGIDAINLRSDGGKTHLLEILRNLKAPIKNDNEIIVFCNEDNKFFLNGIDFIKIITLPKYLNHWLVSGVWQNLFFSKLLKSCNCDILLNLNGTYFGNFKIMSQFHKTYYHFSLKNILNISFLLKP